VFPSGVTSCDVSQHAVTSFEYHIAMEKICCITDVMIEIFVVRYFMTLNVDVHFVRHDELRRTAKRAVTSFDFRIAVENIRCITDVVIKILVVTYYKT
jgi:hypothetical protein